MVRCEDCVHYDVCKFVDEYNPAYCDEYKPTADVVEVVRCKDCIYSEELAKHCEINRKHYRHCKLWRGEEAKNVWHKYTKHHKDYSIVSVDGFCDNGKGSGVNVLY